MKALARSLVWFGIALVVLWLAGSVLSDRWHWSQWLSWIPAIILVPAGMLMMLGQWMHPGRVDARGPFLMVAGLLVQLFTLWWPGSLGHTGGLRVLQWSAGPAMQAREDFGRFVAGIDPDIAILHGVRRLGGTQAIKAWQDDTGAVMAAGGEFVVLSKIPIEQFRIVAWSSNVVLAMCQLDVGDSEPLALLLVDLPSDPGRSRAEVVQLAQSLFDRIPVEPDLIIGDFNLTASSWQLHNFMPGWSPPSHWIDLGVGWGGTFPRRFPIYRIDHVLQAEGRPMVEALTTVDPGLGRHRAQVIELRVPLANEAGQSSSPVSPSSQ